MYEPLVSILIPCYNAEAWIEQCIGSALKQTYANREIVVFDDGSTDRSVEIVKAFGDLVRLETGPNRGSNPARNRLTQMARGEWLQYLDADDYLLPDKLLNQVQLIKDRDQEVDLLYSPVLPLDPITGDYGRGAEQPDPDILINFIYAVALSTSGMLIRREAVSNAGGWNEEQPCCQDLEFVLRLIMSGALCELSPRAETVYRLDNSQSISRKDPSLLTRKYLDLLERLESFLGKSGRLDTKYSKALYDVRMRCARQAYRKDQTWAAAIASRALVHGVQFVRPTSLLPMRYQFVLSFMGFERTERFAAKFRGAA